MIGESVGEHVRRLRLERAASRLKHGDTPITMIAFEAGYETHEAFSRAFRAIHGVSPSEFRLRNGSVPRAASLSGVHWRDGEAPLNFTPVILEGNAIDVKIEKIKPIRVAFVRHIGLYDECDAAWDRLTTELGHRGLLGGETKYIGLCYDDPEVTPPEKVRYDACVSVDESFQPEGEIGVQTIAGGEYAVTTHFGPYSRLGETYARLFGQWLPQSGRELRSIPCMEIYLNDPEGTEPEDLITDIYAPLESR